MGTPIIIKLYNTQYTSTKNRFLFVCCVCLVSEKIEIDVA